MAQFYAEIQGNRGPATRMGSKDSGLTSHTRGWHVGCRVECFYDEVKDYDVIKVYRTSGSGSGGVGDVLIATLYENDEVMFAEALQGKFGIALNEEAIARSKKAKATV